MIQVQLDQASLARVESTLKRIASEELPSAGARALNRAAKAGQTIMVREVAASMGVKQAAVKTYIRTHPATKTRLEANVYAWGKRGIPLITLGATGPEPSRQTPGGVRVQARPSAYPRAFISTMKRGHRGVFERTGRGRLPIREQFTPTVRSVFAFFRAIGLARTRESLLSNLQSEIRYALRKQSA